MHLLLFILFSTQLSAYTLNENTDHEKNDMHIIEDPVVQPGHIPFSSSSYGHKVCQLLGHKYYLQGSKQTKDRLETHPTLRIDSRPRLMLDSKIDTITCYGKIDGHYPHYTAEWIINPSYNNHGDSLSIAANSSALGVCRTLGDYFMGSHFDLEESFSKQTMDKMVHLDRNENPKIVYSQPVLNKVLCLKYIYK
jgi:hypothetical protein